MGIVEKRVFFITQLIVCTKHAILNETTDPIVNLFFRTSQAMKFPCKLDYCGMKNKKNPKTNFQESKVVERSMIVL